VRVVLDTLPHHGVTVLALPWGEPLSRTTVHYAFERACSAAGITDFRWHDLRHTAASHLVMAGVDLRTVQDFLGHRDPKLVMRYAHLSPAHQAAAVAKLGAALTAVPEAARAAANASPTVPNLERSWTVFSGPQTAAKRKYLEDHRLGKWRRGESNPRPKAHPRANLRA
jgi:hypothetical protein